MEHNEIEQYISSEMIKERILYKIIQGDLIDLPNSDELQRLRIRSVFLVHIIRYGYRHKQLLKKIPVLEKIAKKVKNKINRILIE